MAIFTRLLLTGAERNTIWLVTVNFLLRLVPQNPTQTRFNLTVVSSNDTPKAIVLMTLVLAIKDGISRLALVESSLPSDFTEDFTLSHKNVVYRINDLPCLFVISIKIKLESNNRGPLFTDGRWNAICPRFKPVGKKLETLSLFVWI